MATHLKNKRDKYPFHKAMLIPMAGFVAAWVYPVYVNFFNRETMDVHRATDVGIVEGMGEKEVVLQRESRVEKGEGAGETAEEA